MIKVLTVGSDRNLFKKNSPVRKRISRQGTVFSELHVIVFSLSSLSLQSEKIADNVWLYPTNSFTKFAYMRDAERLAGEIVSERKLSSVDTVISAQDPFESGLAAKKIAQKWGLAFHVQIHTDFLSPFFRRSSVLNRIRVAMARFVLPNACSIRVVSARIKESIDRSDIKLQASPQILPVFTDISKFSQTEVTVDLHAVFPQFKFIILMVNRLTPEKDVATGIKAFARVVKKFPHSGLVIVGEGQDKTKLEDFSKKLGLGKNVVFAGGWPENIASYYKTANLFMLTSRFEGYGLVLVEAAAAGCPIVSTDVGIASEILSGSYENFICPVGDEICLAEKAIRLIEDNRLRRQYSLDLALRIDSQGLPDEGTYLHIFRSMLEKCVESGQPIIHTP